MKEKEHNILICACKWFILSYPFGAGQNFDTCILKTEMTPLALVEFYNHGLMGSQVEIELYKTIYY